MPARPAVPVPARRSSVATTALPCESCPVTMRRTSSAMAFLLYARPSHSTSIEPVDLRAAIAGGETARFVELSADAPADLPCEALKEVDVVSALGRLADQIVDPPGVLTNKNAPTVGFDPVENNCRRRSRGHRGLLAKAPFALGNHLLDVFIRQT